MKKLLAAICFVFYLHGFSQEPIEKSSPKSSGERTLIKAIAVIVNPHANKKMPVKQVKLSSSERP